MKKSVSILVGILLIGGGGYWAYSHNRQSGRAERRASQMVTVERGMIEDLIEATGVVQPLNRVEIKPPISGRIENLMAEEGTKVTRGQILGWMSSTDRAAILDAARAKGPEEVQKWQDSYKATPIIAPLSGTIILRNVVVGQTVDSGNVIFAMSDKLIVKANVDETDIGRVRMGMPASITLDSYPAEPIQGEVFQILHEGVNVSNVITYPVKIEPKLTPPFFRSQMTANIRLISGKKEDTLILPSMAVTTTSSGEKQVMTPGPEGKPTPRIVKTGLETTDTVEITEGLQAGDRVILSMRRYVPQQAAANSPLVMGGRRTPAATPVSGQRRKSNGAN